MTNLAKLIRNLIIGVVVVAMLGAVAVSSGYGFALLMVKFPFLFIWIQTVLHDHTLFPYTDSGFWVKVSKGITTLFMLLLFGSIFLTVGALLSQFGKYVFETLSAWKDNRYAS